MSGEKPSWCVWSTPETVQNDVPSATAILETMIAVPLYWWIALQVGTVLPLLISAVVAPLVLLRSDQSVALGLQWFRRFEDGLSYRTDVQYGSLSLAKRSIIWAVVVFSIAVSLCFAWFIFQYRLSDTEWY